MPTKCFSLMKVCDYLESSLTPGHLGNGLFIRDSQLVGHDGHDQEMCCESIVKNNSEKQYFIQKIKCN